VNLGVKKKRKERKNCVPCMPSPFPNPSPNPNPIDTTCPLATPVDQYTILNKM